MSEPASLSPATVAVVAGRPERRVGAPVNPPVVLSSTFVSVGVPTADEPLYGRNANPTWTDLEAALAALEGATQPGVVLASGIAAVAAALALVPAGGRVVAPGHAYQLTGALLSDLERRSSLRTTRVDVADTDAVLAALAAAPIDLLWVESPTNPMLEVADLPAVIAAGHAAGALVVVDSTFATPLALRPLSLGADVVLHSATKYLAGHSDVVLGALLTDDPDLRARLVAHRTLHGAIAGPWEAWLALRGLRTVALRVERSQASAAALAARLAAHPAVVQVRHPSLPGDPGHRRAAEQMTGFGSVLGLRPRGGPAAADAVVDAVRLWVPATSLGGVESMIERRRRFATESPDVPADLLRLSVGIEDVDDLWADLAQALDGLA